MLARRFASYPSHVSTGALALLAIGPWSAVAWAQSSGGPPEGIAGAEPLGSLQADELDSDIVDAPRVTLGGWTYTAFNGAFFGSLGQGDHLARFDAQQGGAISVVAELGGEYGDYPSNFTVLGSELLFSADDGQHGFELWRSDGTESGTQMVLDLQPGKASGLSREGLSRESFAVVDGLAFFMATGADGVRTLYRTDGTGPGTFALAPGLALESRFLGSIADLGGQHYVLSGDRLLRFDGQSLTVVPVDGSDLSDLRTFAGFLYFRADDAQGSELWRSDGVSATSFIDLRPGPLGSEPDALTEYAGRLWFTADDGTHGRELWSTDGSAVGTQLLLDLAPGPGNGVGERTYSAAALTQFAGELWFAGSVAGTYRMWRTDGSLSGTQPLFAGGGGPEVTPFGDGFRQAVVGGTRLAFSGRTAGDWGLWWTGGTEAGTVEVDPSGSFQRSIRYLDNGSITYRKNDTDLWIVDSQGQSQSFVDGGLPSPLPLDAYPRLDHLTQLGSRILLAGDDGHRGREWWALDSAGFEPLGDFYPGPSNGSPSGTVLYQVEFPSVEFRGELYILGTESFGMALWKTDGTAEGTERLAGFEHPFIGPESFEYIDTDAAALDDRLIFAAPSPAAYKYSLMATDGTAEGTEVLAATNIDLSNFKRLGSKVLFSAFDNVGNKSGIYATDGQAGGTQKISESEILGVWTETLVCAGKFFYTARALGDDEFTLWSSDGTSAGTQPVVPAGSSPRPIEPYQFACNGDRVVFSALDESGDLHLWESDGTAAGTQVLTASSLGDSGFSVREVLVVGDQVLFTLDRRLYRLNGDGSWQLAWPSTWNVTDEETPERGHQVIGSRRVAWIAATQSWLGSMLVTTEGTAESAEVLLDLGPVFLADAPNMRLVGGHLIFDVDVPGSDAQLHSLWPGATAMPFGNSCGAGESLPRLSATDPVLGESSSVGVAEALPGSAVVVYLGAASEPQHLASGCTLYADLGSLELVTAGVCDASGSWAAAPVAIPADAALQGATGVLQALVVPSSGAPAGFQLSNGVFLGLGD